MSALCLLDTSVFVEILNIPSMSNKHDEILSCLEQKIIETEDIFLPMATILETGNHISKNGDGNLRRKCAGLFVDHVKKALNGETPFKPISFLNTEELIQWLTDFPDVAMQGLGLGDLSIIHDWRRLCRQNPSRRVYIWSLDQHLSSYDQPAKI